MSYRLLVVSLLVVGLALGASVAGELRAGKKSVPKMAKATYINAIKDSNGTGSGNTRSITVSCDAGDKVLSGGFDELDASSSVRTSSPSDGLLDPPHDHWVVAWNEPTGADDFVDVFVLCSDFLPKHVS